MLYSQTEQNLLQAGLADVQVICPTLRIDLRYAGTSNFLDEILYREITHAFLQAEAAAKLARAQQLLQTTHPHLSIIVFDAARPLHVQAYMFDKVKNTPAEKFVANPNKGSMHNYGMAADVSLVNEKNEELDMGSAFDDFNLISMPLHEQTFLVQQKLSATQYENRLLLRSAMCRAGFLAIDTEWWHFDAEEKNKVRETYLLLP